MSDLYSELLVTRKPSGSDSVLRIGAYVLTGLAVIAGLIVHPLILILAVVLGVVDYFLIPRLSLEFEYLHVNDELDIDKIFSKSKRKKAASIDLNKMEVLAPLGSHQLDSYQNAKTIDFSANDSENKPYAMIVADEKEQKKYLVQLDQRIFDNIKRRFPRKVFEY